MTKQECISKVGELLRSIHKELRVKKIDDVKFIVLEDDFSERVDVIAIVTYNDGVVLTPIDGEPQLIAKRSMLYDAIVAL
jgi:hypothetical protein